MSHYLEGKISLKCSIDLLRRALVGVMPEWDKHIIVDKDGKLDAYNYSGKRVDNKTFHMIVPSNKNPNYKKEAVNIYADLALKHEDDGTWSVMADSMGLGKIKNLEEQLKGEIMRMKVKAWAAMNPGVEITNDVSNENETYTDVTVDSDQARQMLGSF